LHLIQFVEASTRSTRLHRGLKKKIASAANAQLCENFTDFISLDWRFHKPKLGLCMGARQLHIGFGLSMHRSTYRYLFAGREVLLLLLPPLPALPPMMPPMMPPLLLLLGSTLRTRPCFRFCQSCGLKKRTRAME